MHTALASMMNRMFCTWNWCCSIWNEKLELNSCQFK
jgi:hypothetical protein